MLRSGKKKRKTVPYSSHPNRINSKQLDILKRKQFFSAVSTGDEKKFIWYLNQGYPIDTEDEKSRDTALMLACRLGKPNMVQIALEYDAKNDPHPDFGQTALQVAVSSGHAECVQILLETAALSDADHIIVNHEDSQKEAPIHTACRCGNIDILELLLKAGANIHSVDAHGRTCLHCAVQSGRRSCVKYLLQVGAGQIVDERDDRGFTSLHLSIKQCDLNCTKELLVHGADTHMVSPDGLNAIELAKRSRSRKMIDLVSQYETQFFSPEKSNLACQQLFDGLDVFYSPIGQSPKPDSNETVHCESFYIMNDLWHIILHHINGCAYPYFLRVCDNYSQWEDPRICGITDRSMPVPIQERVQVLQNYNRQVAFNQEQSDVLDKSIDLPKSSPEQRVDGRNKEIVFKQVAAPQHNPKPPTGLDFLSEIRNKKDESKTENEEQGHPKSPMTTPIIQDQSTAASSPFPAPSTNFLTEIKGRGFPNHSSSGGSLSEHEKIDGTHKNKKVAHFDQALLAQIHSSKGFDDKKSNISSIEEATKSGINHQTDLEHNLSKYKRMKSVGVPLGSILHKMKSDGLPGHIVSSFESVAEDNNKNTPKTLLKEISSKESYAKYKKMISVGLPLNSVLHKMKNDGLDEEEIKKFELEFNGSSTAEPTHSNFKEQEIADLEIHNDESLSKYNKMVAMRVPPQAVANKMRQDGILQAKITAFEKMHGLSTAAKRSPLNSLPLPPSNDQKKRTSVKMQKIFWNTVSQDKIEQSLWSRGDSESDLTVEDSDIKELEKLFQAKTLNTAKNTVSNSKGKKHATNAPSLLDPRRSYNIAISLAQFKSFPTFDALVESVTSLDMSKFTLQQLQILVTLLPSKDEIKAISSYDGPQSELGKVEQFFLAISKSPGFSKTLRCFVFISQFEENSENLKETLETLERACKDIVGSHRLCDVLKLLLAIGNLVNEGAGKPHAKGITLDSLLKTATKKGLDGKTKVIDVVVGNFMKRDTGSTTLQFMEEIKYVSSIRTDVKDCKASLTELKTGFQTMLLVLKEEREKESPHCIFTTRCETFAESISLKLNNLEKILDSCEGSFVELCNFFALDPKASHAPEIFNIITSFSKVVQDSRDSFLRRRRRIQEGDVSTPKRGSNNFERKDKDPEMIKLKLRLVAQSKRKENEDSNSWCDDS